MSSVKPTGMLLQRSRRYGTREGEYLLACCGTPSELFSPGASNNTQSTSLTTPDQSFVGDSEFAASVGIDSSPLGKRRRSDRSKDDELASQVGEIMPPRGITNLKYSCYANAFIQDVGKHFPDCYA